MLEKYSVLVVDDEVQNIELAEVILKKEGYSLFFAMNADETMHILGKEDIDVVVLDLMLPDIDGFAVLNNIKTNVIYKDIQVIVVSALNDEQSITKALDLGASAYVNKPYDIISLKSKVKEILQRSRLHKLDIESFLDKKFATMLLDEKKKKECIVEFLKEPIDTIALPLVMAYLHWFSKESPDDFEFNNKCLNCEKHALVGEPTLDFLRSRMNKILIASFFEGMLINEEELYKNSSKYFNS